MTFEPAGPVFNILANLLKAGRAQEPAPPAPVRSIHSFSLRFNRSAAASLLRLAEDEAAMRLCASAEYPMGNDFKVLKILVRLSLFITVLVIVTQLAWGDRPVILGFSSMAILSASMTFFVTAALLDMFTSKVSRMMLHQRERMVTALRDLEPGKISRAGIDQIRESISLTGGRNLTNLGMIKLLATRMTKLPV